MTDASKPPAPAHAANGVAHAIGFGALGLILGLVLVSTKGALYGLQGGVSEVATVLPFGYAYAAGMVAAVNPCGILLLPSLVAYYLGGTESEEADWTTRASKAFLLGAMATLGFVVLFAAVGLIFTTSGRALGAWFPIGGLSIGVLFTALGLWMVATGQSFGLTSATRAMGAVRLGSSLGSLFGFGVAYGVASLACTLPVFLVVVGTSLAVGGFLHATGQFVSYALGMGTMLTAVIVGAAFFRGAVTRSIHGVLPYLHRFAAAMLLGAGIFIIAYWLEPSGLIR
ncbi:MAG: cytochrome c biosis protein, transrane region [Chloroflexi bacterium]|nr:cytochrome c biosis protein, transrane region [Chloroflexota bacterium]